MANEYILSNKKTKEIKKLTQKEMDRFFDNRNPDDWIVEFSNE